MKSKIVSFFLLIFTFFLLVFTILAVFMIYSNYTVEDMTEFVQNFISVAPAQETTQNDYLEDVVLETSTTTATLAEEKVGYTEQVSNGKFYYEQLNNNQKILYNGFQKNKENMISGTYVIEYGNIFSDTLKKENGTKILQEDYQTAVEAYTHDNADLFYLDITKLYLNIETIKKVWNTTYNVYVGPKSEQTYYSDEFEKESEVREIYNQIENVRDQIMQKMGSDNFRNIKTIHDYLIQNIEYDNDYNSKGTYTIYGALIGKKCVCDGYARAFKYLANCAGMECEIIQGTATNSTGKTENHAWNAIKLEDKWYYVDTTWDDPIILGAGIVPESYYYKYFLKGTSAFSNDHLTDGEFSDGGKEFSYPIVSTYDY